jgi:hypothetical protein
LGKIDVFLHWRVPTAKQKHVEKRVHCDCFVRLYKGPSCTAVPGSSHGTPACIDPGSLH